MSVSIIVESNCPLCLYQRTITLSEKYNIPYYANLVKVEMNEHLNMHKNVGRDI